MTETSSVPLAIEAAGWSLGKMCADLVRGRGGPGRAVGRRPARSQTPVMPSGQGHPGGPARPACSPPGWWCWALAVCGSTSARAPRRPPRRAAEPPVPLAAVAPAGARGERRVRAVGHVRRDLRPEHEVADPGGRRGGPTVRVVTLLRTGRRRRRRGGPRCGHRDRRDAARRSGRWTRSACCCRRRTPDHAGPTGELDLGAGRRAGPDLARPAGRRLRDAFRRRRPGARASSRPMARLPEARGRLRNGAYALQWWLFAASPW